MTFTFNEDLQWVIRDVLYDPLDNCGEPECVSGEITKAIQRRFDVIPKTQSPG